MEIRSSQMGATLGGSSAAMTQPWETAGISSSMQVLSGTDCCSFYSEPPSTANVPFEVLQIIYELPPNLELGGDLKQSITRARDQMRKGGPYLRHKDIFGV